MHLRSVFKIFSMLALVGLLAACESSEERAEGHYQSGLKLLEENDVERALVEFRNVFNLNGSHREARQVYARIVREQGKRREAYGQYLRLVEQYPDDLEGRIALAEMAFVDQSWEEFDRHSSVAIEAAPEAPRIKTIAAAAAYRSAIQDDDGPARRAAHAQVIALTEEQPDSRILLQLEIAGYIADMTYSKALEAIDRAIANEPETRNYYNMRLAVLNQLEETAEIETQLRDMVTLFPEDDVVKQTLIRFYMSRDEADKAENFLREIADPDAEEPSLYLSLLQLIGELRGPEALMAELDRVIGEVSEPATYRAMRAGLVFQQGDRTKGIADMEAILEGAEPSGDTNRIKVLLARMLLDTGNDVGARRLVEEVLTADPGQVDALRMSATWQIEADDMDGAIATLRQALDQAPQDVASMTLMSRAYLRAGNRDLARDFLSLAVDASNSAPAEAVRYARFLADEERYIPAEQVLVAALRANSDNPDLLVELGRTYLLMEDEPRLRQVIASLSRLDTPATKRAAIGFETTLIERERGTEAALSYLEGVSDDLGNPLTAAGAMIRARISSGDTAGALDTARAALAEDPDDLARLYLLANTQAATGDLPAAEATYRALIEDHPNRARLWLELIRIVAAQGRTDEMDPLITEGLAVNADAPDLLWVRAGILERDGDIEGAIVIYEDLYQRNSNSVIIANNLASLLSSRRDDEASLARAATVAARLRDLAQPAFQDTWGWIAFRQGRLEEALPPLEAAAAGLPRDPIVQYHLGRAYEAAARPEEAIAQYERAIEVGGEDSTLSQVEDARSRLETLKSATPEQ